LSLTALKELCNSSDAAAVTLMGIEGEAGGNRACPLFIDFCIAEHDAKILRIRVSAKFPTILGAQPVDVLFNKARFASRQKFGTLSVHNLSMFGVLI